MLTAGDVFGEADLMRIIKKAMIASQTLNLEQVAGYNAYKQRLASAVDNIGILQAQRLYLLSLVFSHSQ
jgi:hypothetical protein